MMFFAGFIFGCYVGYLVCFVTVWNGNSHD